MPSKRDPVIKKIRAMPKTRQQFMFELVYLTASRPEKRRIREIFKQKISPKWMIYCKKCKEFHYEKTRKSHRAILV